MINKENFMKNLVNQRFAAILAFALFFSLTCLNAQADSRQFNARCTLKIDGITHMNGQCHFSSNKDSDNFDDLKLLVVCPNGRSVETFNCYGYEQRVARKGVFGVLFRENGAARFCWNDGNYRKAHDCYEGLRRTGACWANSRAIATVDPRQARNIEFCAWRL
jgi:hypothetical protein